MAEIIKETISTGGASYINPAVAVTPATNNATSSQSWEYVVYFIFGAINILLAFRLILKLMGASSNSAFVDLTYGLSGLFILPFEGIFRRWFNPGIETTSVFEPSTMVAIIFYSVLAWGIVKLIRIGSGEQQLS